jgi:hypothetical protein
MRLRAASRLSHPGTGHEREADHERRRMGAQSPGRYRYPNPRTVSIASRPSIPSLRRR